MSVSQLLRKAVLVAKKLGLEDTEQWLVYERSGYPIGSQIPEYRDVDISHIEAWNPYANRWVRALSPEDGAENAMLKQAINQPLASIEDGVNSNQILSLSIPGTLSNHGTELRFVINSLSVKKVVDAVRDSIMDWAIELEKRGIIGEGLSFSEKELETAHQSSINITFGDGASAQLQLNSPHGQQSMHVSSNNLTGLNNFIRALTELIAEAKVDTDTREELNAEIATLEAQAKSPKPKAKVIAEALKSIRTISESVVGGVLTSTVSSTLVDLIPKFGG